MHYTAHDTDDSANKHIRRHYKSIIAVIVIKLASDEVGPRALCETSC